MISRWSRLLPFLLAAGYVAIIGTPWENTFSLAASGKLDLNVAWFYRFREAALLDGFGASTVFVKIMLGCIHLTSSRFFWAALCMTIGVISFGQSRLLRVLLLLPLTAGLAFGEAFIIWCLTLALVAHIITNFVSRDKTQAPWARTVPAAGIALVMLIFFIGLIVSVANPRDALTRQKVLAGKSFSDRLHVFTGSQRIDVEDSCLAVLNPDDLRGINAIEQLSRASLYKFSEIRLLDLKVVERNYLLLNLKNETGKFMFSDAARAYAGAEKLYAATQLIAILSAPSVCLIAAFEVLPEREAKPHSRAREILDLRKAAGRETHIIQLTNP